MRGFRSLQLTVTEDLYSVVGASRQPVSKQQQLEVQRRSMQSRLAGVRDAVPIQEVLAAVANTCQDESCQQFHSGLTCNMKAISQFMSGTRSVIRMYLAVHLLPLLLFRRKQLRQDPGRECLRVVQAFLKSLLFAGGYSALVRRVVCLVATHFSFVGEANMVAAVLASVTLLFEPVGRQSEIALYALNKGTEVLYLMARRRGLPVKVPKGEVVVAGVSLSLIVYHYLDCPEAIRSSYRMILDRLLRDL